MMEFLIFTFQSFWHFVGVVILLYVPVEILKFAINRPLRHRNIMKHGWPPSHCDGDGDFKKAEQ